MNFEENQVPEAILDKLTKVCTCRSITRKTIKEAILDGAHTFPQLLFDSLNGYTRWVFE